MGLLAQEAVDVIADDDDAADDDIVGTVRERALS